MRSRSTSPSLWMAAAIALFWGAPAGAVTWSISQIGGSYTPGSDPALPGDTIELSLNLVIEPGDVGASFQLAQIGLIATGGVAAGSGVSGTEPPFYFGPVLAGVVSPVGGTTDIGELDPPTSSVPGVTWQAKGWELSSLDGVAVTAPGTIPLGTATITLDGTSGDILTTPLGGDPWASTVFLDGGEVPGTPASLHIDGSVPGPAPTGTSGTMVLLQDLRSIWDAGVDCDYGTEPPTCTEGSSSDGPSAPFAPIDTDLQQSTATTAELAGQGTASGWSEIEEWYVSNSLYDVTFRLPHLARVELVGRIEAWDTQGFGGSGSSARLERGGTLLFEEIAFDSMVLLDYDAVLQPGTYRLVVEADGQPSTDASFEFTLAANPVGTVPALGPPELGLLGLLVAGIGRRRLTKRRRDPSAIRPRDGRGRGVGGSPPCNTHRSSRATPPAG